MPGLGLGHRQHGCSKFISQFWTMTHPLAWDLCDKFSMHEATMQGEG